MQASEKRIHFIVSRQTRQQTPDILQEAGWNNSGSPQPCSLERNYPNKVRPGSFLYLLFVLWETGTSRLVGVLLPLDVVFRQYHQKKHILFCCINVKTDIFIYTLGSASVLTQFGRMGREKAEG